MPRYPHIIAPMQPGEWPRRILCIEVDGVATVQMGNGGPTELQGIRASVVRLSERDGSYHATAQHTLANLGAVWVALIAAAHNDFTTWVFTHGAASAWSMLGLWDRIEDGRIELVDKDWCAPSSKRKQQWTVRRKQKDLLASASSMRLEREAEALHGYLVMEDPPNILRCRMAELPGRIMWVDTRNYGVVPDAQPNDCEARARWVAEWLCDYRRCADAYGLGHLCASAGSQAMVSFRTHHYHSGVSCHTNHHILQLESESYHGGRAEVFRFGEPREELYVLDVRSLYPSICAAHELPVRAVHYQENDSLEENAPLDRPMECVARVRLETPEPAYPVLRSRDYHTGEVDYDPIDYRATLSQQTEVIYPIGRLCTVLAGPELTDAIVMGHVVAVEAYCRYEMAPALADYATAIYRMRCDTESLNNTGMSQLAKRLLVTLPGKFGQRDRKWIVDPDAMPLDMWGEWSESDEWGNAVRCRAVGGVVLREVLGGFAADAAPAIASWICSMGRTILLGLMRCVGWDHVYYCDTDSIITDRHGYDWLCATNMIHSGRLGKLELRARTSDLHIYGIKMYALDGQLTCAGLPRNATRIEAGGFSYTRDRGIKEQIARGEVPRAVQELITYRRQQDYRHGRVLPDGSVYPISLEMW